MLTVVPREIIDPEFDCAVEEFAEYAWEEHLAGGAAEAKGVLATDILSSARKIVGRRAQLQVSYISSAGNPAEEIIAFAHKHAANALYLGSRGLSSVGGFFLGSVSRRVRAKAPCRVVIIPKQGIKDR